MNAPAKGWPRLEAGCSPGGSAVERLHGIGNRSLLDLPLTGLLGSVDTPPDLILPALDLAIDFRRLGMPVIGGFQTPIEERCLEILLRGHQPVVISPARSLGMVRIPPQWSRHLDAGRLLIVSPFDDRARRSSAASGVVRNDLIVALAAQLVVIHGRPGGRAIAAASTGLARGIPVLCFNHFRNRDLLLRGALPIENGGFGNSRQTGPPQSRSGSRSLCRDPASP